MSTNYTDKTMLYQRETVNPTVGGSHLWMTAPKDMLLFAVVVVPSVVGVVAGAGYKVNIGGSDILTQVVGTTAVGTAVVSIIPEANRFIAAGTLFYVSGNGTAETSGSYMVSIYGTAPWC